jgi:hypothetical protein
MAKHDIGQARSADQADKASAGRAAWVRPSLVRLSAGDAELGTRPNGPDGPFSVS